MFIFFLYCPWHSAFVQFLPSLFVYQRVYVCPCHKRTHRSGMQAVFGFGVKSVWVYIPPIASCQSSRCLSIEVGRFMCRQLLSDLDISGLLKHFSWTTMSFDATDILISLMHKSQNLTEREQISKSQIACCNHVDCMCVD